MVRLLLARGVEVSGPRVIGNPLALAARFGHLIVVEMLLAAGTAIHGSLLAALQSGHEEISGILLRMTDQVGSVELLAAAKRCSPSLMCELIKKASKTGMIDIVRAIYEA
jgi:hypothetical protein